MVVDVEGCIFPENLMYDEDLKLWFREKNGNFIIGITSAYSWYIGKITTLRFIRKEGILQRSKNLCIIESLKRIEPIRLPFEIEIVDTNENVVKNPKLVNNYNYSEGWIALIKPIDKNYFKYLHKIDQIDIRAKIKDMQVKCFKAMPDITLFEIGTECSAVLTKLNELIKELNKDDVIMLVSDDPTAYVEIIRWTDQTKNVLVDYRKENNIWYFILKIT